MNETNEIAQTDNDNKIFQIFIPVEVLLLTATLLEEAGAFGCARYLLREKEQRTAIRTYLYAGLLVVLLLLAAVQTAWFCMPA